MRRLVDRAWALMVAEHTFPITGSQSINLQSTTPLEQLHCCSEAPILFVHNDQTLILSTDSIRENLFTLRTLLGKVLAGSLKLHSSLNNSIGYWFNYARSVNYFRNNAHLSRHIF